MEGSLEYTVHCHYNILQEIVLLILLPLYRNKHSFNGTFSNMDPFVSGRAVKAGVDCVKNLGANIYIIILAIVLLLAINILCLL